MVVELMEKWVHLQGLLRKKPHPEQLISNNTIAEITIDGSCWDKIMYQPWRSKLLIPVLSDGPFLFHLNDGSNLKEPIAVVTGKEWRTLLPAQYAYCDTFIGTRPELLEIAEGPSANIIFFGPVVYNRDLDTLPDWQKPLVVYRVHFPNNPEPTLVLKEYRPEFLTNRWIEETKPPYVVGIWIDYRKLSGHQSIQDS